MPEYKHSPKVIFITGPRAAGKTHIAMRLEQSQDYHRVWVDAINGKVRRKCNLAHPNDMYSYTPENHDAYKTFIREEIKGARYKNLVIEGDALRSLYILDTFIEAVTNYYGEYAVFKAFSLVPDRKIQHDRYMLREIKRVKQYIKENAGKPKEEHEGDKRVRGFDWNEAPDPPGFEKVDDGEVILQWARDNQDTIHQGLPEKYADLIKCVADSDTYTPFYQTVEVDGLRIIKGVFNSNLSWNNIMTLNPDFKGKSVADLGAMHGYFTFKAEEHGAREAVGLELNPSSVEVARTIAKARKSNCTFEVCNVENDELPKHDVYLAMNMLHWIGDLDGFLNKLAAASNEIIMEIGEVQIKQVTRALWPMGFRPVSVQESHRPDKRIGQRQLFHFVRKQAVKDMPLKADAQSSSAACEVQG